MYLGYWKIGRRPFDNAPDASMYYGMHQSVDDAVSKILDVIEQGSEPLAIVTGAVGTGKTTCLRTAMETLDKEQYRIMALPNANATFPQLLKKMIDELGNLAISPEENDPTLLVKFKDVLLDARSAGKKVVLFIDESSSVRPPNLETIRSFVNVLGEDPGLFTMVLAGQPELAQRIEDPMQPSLFRRPGVLCRLDAIASRDTMKEYIEHRLERAGLSGETPFTEAAYDAIWSLSGGVPRLVNKICKMSLIAGETHRLRKVDADIVTAIGIRFERVYRRIQKSLAKAHSRAFSLAGEEEIFDESIAVPEDNLSEKVLPPPVEEILPNFYRRRKPVPGPAPAAVRQPAKAQLPQKPIRAPVDAIQFGALTQAEREKIASELATERVEKMTGVQDPFEEWSRAREEILKEMNAQRRAASAVGHAA